jgi:hypothetical protein
LLVNHTKLVVLFIAMFIGLCLIPMRGVTAQVIAPKVTSDRLVYPIWHMEGKINLTISQLVVNQTYYVWLQKPSDSSTRYAGIKFIGRNGTIPTQLTISNTDRAGTYLVSLSTSISSDTRIAAAHFGVYGTDLKVYERTNKMVISGGGFAPNSTISMRLQTGSGPIAGFPVDVLAGPNGDFTYTYRIAPSAPVGGITVTAVGPAYDSHNSTSVSSVVDLGATSVKISRSGEPRNSVERTANAAMMVSITYPDGTPVVTSTTNSTRTFVVSDPSEQNVAEVRMVLSDSRSGGWTLSWTPPPSADLGMYHFEVLPTDFDDSYGNLGTGKTVSSSPFQVTRLNVGLAFRTNPTNATIQRTQEAQITIGAKYLDGTNFENVTQTSGTITDPDGTTHALGFNRTLEEFVGYYNSSVGTPLGQVEVAATITDLFGNVAAGTYTIQVVPAILDFTSEIPATAQRTTVLNAATVIKYPDGSLLTPDQAPSGFNVTITHGNFTWTSEMGFNSTSDAWSSGYILSQNQTLGDYDIMIIAQDAYGNGGQLAAVSKVVPAVFQFVLPVAKEQASPGTVLNMAVYTLYPNGSLLTPQVGGVVIASYSNSSGVFTLPLVFNATDRSWHMFFVVPDPGLRFGLTMAFSFSADDAFGNAGAVSKAFELDVGAGASALILATIFGAIPPIALIGWAIATVTSRRRKHKP